MIYSIPIEELIKKRKSVRTYSGVSLSAVQKAQIHDYMNSVTSPFSGSVRFQLIDQEDNAEAPAKVGTYGFIKGASQFIGVAVKKGHHDVFLNVGYTFEKIVLFLTSINLGTCWLGGTFNRTHFVEAMNLQEDETISIVSPVGMAAQSQNFRERMMRMIAKSDNRKPFDEIFFNGNFETPLSKQDAGDYLIPLEMLRLAPSASNSQPWRVLKSDNQFHFYMLNKYPMMDLSLNDVGIAMCHFELTAIEKGLKGSWVTEQSIAQKVEDKLYVKTWKTE